MRREVASSFCVRLLRRVSVVLPAILILCAASPALAGPPYLSDDPETTDYRHFEIYAFSNGTAAQDGTTGEGGIDFNYGAGPNLQLTAVLPGGYGFPTSAPAAAGLSNIELAAKYRFLRQDRAGLDVSFFPRLFLPSASSTVGEQHTSLLLPLWLEKDWGDWSAFGGGGCEINRGGNFSRLLRSRTRRNAQAVVEFAGGIGNFPSDAGHPWRPGHDVPGRWRHLRCE